MISREAEHLGLRIDGVIRFDDDVFESTLLGEKLRYKTALEGVRSLAKTLKLL